MVDYDSGMSITLEANFEVIVGAIFNAIIDNHTLQFGNNLSGIIVEIKILFY